eukprot:596999-Prymnesium_polylepis.1
MSRSRGGRASIAAPPSVCPMSEQTWLRMPAAHSRGRALAGLRHASDGSPVGRSLLLVNRLIGLVAGGLGSATLRFGVRSAVRLEPLAVTRDR